MHRSASTTRVSDEFYSGPPTAKALLMGGGHRSLVGMDQLPTYNPQSEVAKKEASRARSAENAIHIIPVVLIVCALVLWFFSSPHIDMVNKDNSIVARIKNMTIDGYSNGTLSSLDIKQEDLDNAEQQAGSEENRRMLANVETE